jgi:microcystin synthetase protein McyG
VLPLGGAPVSAASDRLAGLSPAKRALLDKRLAAKGSTASAERIAIVAAACRFPGGASSPQAFWQLLLDARDAVTDVPPSRWDGAALFDGDPLAPNRMQSRCGAFLQDLDRFDAGFFGISPREAALMDPQQRLLMETAWEALEAGGQAVDQLAGSATGVFIGAHSQSSDYYLLQLAQAGGLDSHSSTGSAHSILANRLSYAFDLRGPSMAIDTACSSSLVAVHLACQSLRTGESDLALAGGVNLMLLPSAGLGFSKLQILSPRGRCRSFDASADGIVRGEGCGLVVLKRLSDAMRDGDPVLALIAGSAVNQDGASNGLTAPNGPAQESVIRRALAMAGFGPERIGMVETHGTGTPLGDPVETEALARVLGSAGPRCWLGAVKTNIGHLEAAAGIAGLIKAVWCVREGVVPPNLHFTRPNPHLALEGTRLAVPAALTPWPAAEHPRATGISSFGFGGTNAHVILEQHVEAARVAAPSTVHDQWFTVSARDPQALEQAMRDSAAALRQLPPHEWPDVVHTATARRSHHAHRVSVAGASAQAAADALDARRPDARASRPSGEARPMVWVYSGQGGVWPGMGRTLYDSEPVFRAALDGVEAAFERNGGGSVRAAVLEADADRLADTGVAQPALFALQIALSALWRSWGLAPGAVVGHSVGEVAAAHTAGVLTLDDAVRVVLVRSRSMDAARGHGRMAQVDSDAAALLAVLTTRAGTVSVAALNGPASTVLSGAPEALQSALATLAANGISARPLDVDYAFHSAQMEPLVGGIVAALGTISPQPAALPIVSTVTGRWASAGADFDAAHWGRNVRNTVLFAPAVAQLLDGGYRGFLEIGPHPALGTGILAQADAQGAEVVVAASLRRGVPARQALLATRSALYEAGCAMDWAALRDPKRRVVSLPAYPWQRRSHWLDAPDAAALAFNITGRSARDPASASVTGYEMAWRPQPTAAPAFDLDALIAPLQASSGDEPEAAELAAEADALAHLELRAAALACHAVRSISAGAARIAADPVAPGIAARHQRLWRRLLQLAEQVGFVAHGADGWRVMPTEPEAADATTPAARVEAALLERCGSSVAAVLRGEVDPLTLLFTDTGRESAADLYAVTASARLYNGLAAQAIARLAGSAARPLRVLEVGAGTGSTCAALLPVLPAGSAYCYTDVSPLFLHDAQVRLGGKPVSFTFKRFDVEQSPASQGFAAGGFDVVVAANVLHATADLARALDHVRALLAPGGVLLLIETVGQRAWADLTFGLTEGWWRFADAPLRTETALLDVPQWLALLRAAGFDAIQPVGEQASRHAVQPQVLIAARAGAPLRAQRLADTAWQVVKDRGGFAARLADAIRSEGGRCDCVDVAALDPATRLNGVVHCAALDAPSACNLALEGLAGALDGVDSALATAQRLLVAAHDTRLWLLTRGAQHVSASDRTIAPTQSLLWGLGRSLALEQPQAWGGLLDLDAAAPLDDAAVSAVLDALVSRDGEDQAAVRGGARHVARLTQRALPPNAALVLDAAAAYIVTGGFGGLGPKVASWLADRGARCIVLVGRRGLPAADADTALHATIAALRQRGVELVFEATDVADREAMQSAFERLERAGRAIRGVVHAAAAIRFEALKNVSAASLRDALRAKVQGSWVLHELTRDRALDLFALFSSGTTVFGAKGLAAYAAANQFLGALAWHRSTLGLPATCVDWGAWSEIRLLGREGHGDVERLGLRPMDDAAAFDALQALVTGGVAQAMVADIDWAIAAPAYQAHGMRPFLSDVAASTAAAQSAAAPARADLRAELMPASAHTRRARLIALVRSELARVLGLASAAAIEADKGFFELGLDSLMAMQMRRRLGEQLAIELPATVTFNHPNVAQLAGHLLELLGLNDAAPRAPERVSVDNAAAELSDDDVRHALLAELEQLEGLADTVRQANAPGYPR